VINSIKTHSFYGKKEQFTSNNTADWQKQDSSGLYIKQRYACIDVQ